MPSQDYWRVKEIVLSELNTRVIISQKRNYRLIHSYSDSDIITQIAARRFIVAETGWVELLPRSKEIEGDVLTCLSKAGMRIKAQYVRSVTVSAKTPKGDNYR